MIFYFHWLQMHSHHQQLSTHSQLIPLSPDEDEPDNEESYDIEQVKESSRNVDTEEDEESNRNANTE